MIYPWQNTQWQQIQSPFQQQRLAHGHLFHGHAGLGKKDFAHSVAALVLCKAPAQNATNQLQQACGECSACKLIAAGTHPDYKILAPEESGKAIKVDDVRKLSTDMTLTAQFGGYKICIIEQADQMNINAANSLLKTLEEPVAKSLLILISNHPQNLPITVRSRCQQMAFQTPQKALAEAWLQQKNINNAGLLLNLAHGAPLLAAQMDDKEYLEQRQQLIDALLSIAAHKPVLEFAVKLAKLPKQTLLGWFYDWLADLLKLHQCGPQSQLVHQDQIPALQKLVNLSRVQPLYAMLDEINNCIQLKSIPLNAQMLWEDLLLSWQRQIKRA